MWKSIGPICAMILVAAVSMSGSGQESVDIVLQRADKAALSEADAVILLDAGRTKVLSDGRIEYVSHKQILLRSWEAIDTYGQVDLSYDEDLEEFALIYGRTLQPSGEVAELDDAGIRISSYAEGGGEEAYSELKTVTLSMPALRPGVVIDYEYTIAEEAAMIENQFYDRWWFEWSDPVQASEYVLDVPKAFELSWRISGRTVEPEIQSSSDRIEYWFRVEDVEPLRSEIGMPSLAALQSFVAVSSIVSWNEIVAWWWDLAEEKMVPDATIDATATALTADTVTDEERISRLFDFVAREIRYVSLLLGSSGYDPRPAADTLATRYGDCKDQAMLLIALLRSVGIDAYPVLISAEAGYDVDWSDPPSPAPFGHVIVAVVRSDGDRQFLDPTCSLCTAAYTDGYIRGRTALLISPNPDQFLAQIDTGKPESSESIADCTLIGSLSDDGLLGLEADVVASGDVDIDYRSTFLYYRPSEREELFKILANVSLPQCRMLGYDCSDLEDTHTPVAYSVRYEKENAVRRIGGGLGLLLLPYGPAYPFPEDYSGTVVHERRSYPLLTYAEQIVHTGRIDVGDLTVAELPSDVVTENRVGCFEAHYAMEETTIVYERNLRIDVTEVLPEEYPLYQDLIETMLEDAEAPALLKL